MNNNISVNKICIVSPEEDLYSETFVRAHIERIPADVKVLYGKGIRGSRYLPWKGDDKQPLVSQKLRYNITRTIISKVFNLPSTFFLTEAIKRFLLNYNIDAVLAEYGPTGVAMMKICEEVNIPLIVHFHGFGAYLRGILDVEGQQYSELFKSASAIVAVSKHMVRQLQDLGAPAEKIFYNPCGADTSMFNGAEPGMVPPVFLTAGRFADVKGPHLTILAFKRTLEACPEARMVMIGDGKLWEACRLMAKALGIDQAVDFLGSQPHEAVASYMKQARAFLQHSVHVSNGLVEGTPVAVVEAGAAGLPVIATRSGGIPDVVVDGKTGLLVEEGDIEGMANCMIQLVKNPGLAAQLGEDASKRIHAEFSMEKSIINIWGIIQQSITEYQKN